MKENPKIVDNLCLLINILQRPFDDIISTTFDFLSQNCVRLFRFLVFHFSSHLSSSTKQMNLTILAPLFNAFLRIYPQDVVSSITMNKLEAMVMRSFETANQNNLLCLSLSLSLFFPLVSFPHNDPDL